jgi:hypothetical protein
MFAGIELIFLQIESTIMDRSETVLKCIRITGDMKYVDMLVIIKLLSNISKLLKNKFERII